MRGTTELFLTADLPRLPLEMSGRRKQKLIGSYGVSGCAALGPRAKGFIKTCTICRCLIWDDYSTITMTRYFETRAKGSVSYETSTGRNMHGKVELDVSLVGASPTLLDSPQDQEFFMNNGHITIQV